MIHNKKYPLEIKNQYSNQSKNNGLSMHFLYGCSVRGDILYVE